MVYILPGIEGRSPANESIARGLVLGGVLGEVKIFDWTTWTGTLGWYIHLADVERNKIQATRLARAIVRHRKRHPDGPVYLIAHSGGAEIALSATELLPRSLPVEGVVLLAGAVSPQRDLTDALQRTRRGIWNFHSPYDVAFLVLGTAIFGTSDRQHCSAAGAVGFELPGHATEETARLYARRLFQIRYDWSMARDGNPGTHSGWTHPRFVAKWLAPIIRDQVSRPARPVIPATRKRRFQPRTGARDSRTEFYRSDLTLLPCGDAARRIRRQRQWSRAARDARHGKTKPVSRQLHSAATLTHRTRTRSSGG